MKQHMKGAFTLIELLVVIAIVSLLAAILFPVFGRVRENARRSSCVSNMKQMGLAVSMYSGDNDGRYPMASSVDGSARLWADYIYPYIKNAQIFTCPSVAAGDVTARGRSWATIVPTGPIGQYFGYGYNYQYLGNSRTLTTRPGFPYTATDAVLTAPALTVAIADTSGVGTTGTTGTYTIDPPRHVFYADGTTPRGSGRSDAGIAYYPNNAAATDGVETMRSVATNRHLEMVAVAFADGHAKAMKASVLDDFDGNGIKDNGYFNGRGVADNLFY